MNWKQHNKWFTKLKLWLKLCKSRNLHLQFDNINQMIRLPNLCYYNLITCLFLFQHKKLTLVSSCMEIIMTINGVDCKATVLDNEITCRIPKNLAIPSQGAPVKVWVSNRLNLALINLSWLYILFMMHSIPLCFLRCLWMEMNMTLVW